MSVAHSIVSGGSRLVGENRSRQCGDLPIDIAFLREFGVDASILREAAAAARRQGVDAAAALLASGGVTDTLFYRSLASFIDAAPFPDRVPALRPGTDARRAIASGRVALADGTWLLAPRGRALRLLLTAARTADVVPRRIAITTPARLEALVLRQAGDALARRASEALPALAPALSARGKTCRTSAVAATMLVAAAISIGLVAPVPFWSLVGAIFLAAIVLRWAVCASGMPDATREIPPSLPDTALPFYTVLVPLHHEANMAGEILGALRAIDYPAAKLEILVLLETHDVATRIAFAAVKRPTNMRVVIVPPGQPRTKPRALNFGLALARGTIVTVFDAEDRPDPAQLRRAAAGFAAGHPDLACLQGRLVIRDPNDGILRRLFALEYAQLFTIHNVGLARLRLPLPLGGTSNHFLASALHGIGGWDAWNVTEDADLGVRLARFGYRTEALDSATSEEAPARLDVWMKQRRRWTKGWMQVALVLTRDRTVWRDLGFANGAAVALMLVNLVVGPLATVPIVALAAWQLSYGRLGMDATVLVLLVPLAAVASTLWCGLAGARAGGLARLWPWIPLLVPYQILIAAAACGGLVDLCRDPYGWRKTPHGAAALNRSSRAMPPPPRTVCRRWKRGSRPRAPETA